LFLHFIFHMTKEIKLAAQSRGEKNVKIKKIRADGFVPAVVYGFGRESRGLKVKQLDFERVFEQAGESNLIDLIIDKKEPVKVIIKDTQKDAVKGGVIHVDFYQVDMSKKITTEIPLNLIGESRAESELGGTLIKNINSIEVECLPGDLKDHIDIDLSKLKNFGDVVRLADLVLPSGMAAISEPDEVVVSVIEPRKEVEEEKPKEEAKEEAPTAEAKEGEKKKKGEEKKEEKGGNEEKGSEKKK